MHARQRKTPVYPSLWSRTFPSAGRTPDQQDAYATAKWLRRADSDGSLGRFLSPELEPHERKTAEIEGWEPFAWKHNALRHSFISYRLAAVPNTAQVALEAGNSPQMIFGHYRARFAETHQ